MSFYQANLAVLEARFAGIGSTLGPEPSQAAPGWESAQATDGNPTARLNGAALHSFRAPGREAAKIVRGSGQEEGLFCLYGFGLGYVAEACLASLSRLVVVIEPDVARLRTALVSRDLRTLLANDRLSLVLDPDPMAFASYLGSQPPSGLVWLALTAVRNADNPLHDRFKEVFDRRSGREDVNRNTLARFGKSWVRNLAANLPRLAAAGPVADWSQVFAGKPALLVAAGPSLGEVMPHLPALAERMPIIAVDTAYRACLAAGVVPDFLIVVDPQYWNARHLDGCDTSASILISESSTHPAVFAHSYRALYFCSSIFPLGKYLEKFTRVRGDLGAGGSVATTAWDFVRSSGAGPIYVAGLDLGFPGLETHFRGGYFEQRMLFRSGRWSPGENLAFHALRDGEPYLVASNDGGKVLTDRRLVIYKWWFEDRLAERRDCDTRNLSSRGVAIKGMPLTNLEEALAHSANRGSLDPLIAGVMENASRHSEIPARNDLASGVHTLLEELGGLEELCRTTLETVHVTRTKMDQSMPIEAEIAALENADARITSAQGKDVLGFLIRPALDALGEQKSSLGATEVLYRELEDSAAFHDVELRKHLPRLLGQD